MRREAARFTYRYVIALALIAAPALAGEVTEAELTAARAACANDGSKCAARDALEQRASDEADARRAAKQKAAKAKRDEGTMAGRALASDTKETAAKRAAALKRAASDGLVGKIDIEHATVTVGQPFYDLDYDLKQNLVFFVVMEGMTKRGKPEFDLTIIDRKNGKTVGHFFTSSWSFQYDGP